MAIKRSQDVQRGLGTRDWKGYLLRPLDQAPWFLTVVVLVILGYQNYDRLLYWLIVVLVVALSIPLSVRRRNRRLRNAIEAERLNRETVSRKL